MASPSSVIVGTLMTGPAASRFSIVILHLALLLSANEAFQAWHRHDEHKAEERVVILAATAGRKLSRRTASERASRRAFFGVSALLFAASAALTIVWCATMSAI